MDIEEAYSMIKEGIPIRFAENGTIEPNFEVKIARGKLNLYSMENRLRIVLGSGNKFFITYRASNSL